MQLAYYLAAYQRNIRGVLSLWFILVSSNTNPIDVSNHISDFVNDFIKKSEEDLTEDKFQTLKKSLISKTLEPFHSLSDYFDFVCKEVSRGTFCFDRKTNAEQLNKWLDQIKKQDIMNMLKECLCYSLEIWAVAQSHRKTYMQKGEIVKSKQIVEIHKEQFHKDTTVSGQMSPQE